MSNDQSVPVEPPDGGGVAGENLADLVDRLEDDIVGDPAELDRDGPDRLQDDVLGEPAELDRGGPQSTSKKSSIEPPD